MKDFTRWQSRLSREVRRGPYVHNGRRCLEDLLSALRSSRRPWKDYVLVSIDFEGRAASTRVNEVGFSCLETKQVFNNTGRLETYDDHFVMGNSSRKSIFSTSVRTTVHMLPQILQNLFGSYQNIVLVGHGLWTTEIDLMDQYGCRIECLPNVIGASSTPVALSCPSHPHQQSEATANFFIHRFRHHRHSVPVAGNKRVGRPTRPERHSLSTRLAPLCWQRCALHLATTAGLHA